MEERESRAVFADWNPQIGEHGAYSVGVFHGDVERIYHPTAASYQRVVRFVAQHGGTRVDDTFCWDESQVG